jgi:hypothetical protein
METQVILETLTKLNDKMDNNWSEMSARLDTKHEEMLARMREEIKSGQEKMKSTVTAKMDALIADRKNDRKETSCQETMEARLEYEEPASWDIKDVRRKSTAYHEAMERFREDSPIQKCCSPWRSIKGFPREKSE